jgi:hypothetical protein
MKSNNRLISVSILFVILAAAFSVVIWEDVSLAPTIAFFALGFGSGVAAGIWFSGRKS